jgi:hypothetical protein
MKCQLAVWISVISFLSIPVLGQQSATNSTAACTFEDGKQLTVQYAKIPEVKKANLSSGKVWTPGEKPMVLFTQTDLRVGNSKVPVGAYSLYLIPGKDHWTLIVNKDVNKEQYREQQEVVRAPMDVGQLGQAQPFSLFFAHVAPKQCNMRIYEEKTGAWAEFREN